MHNHSIIGAAFLLSAFSADSLLGQQVAQHGTVVYEVFDPVAAQADSPAANLRFNGGAGPDCLFEHGWFYRMPGDARENAFRDDGTYVGASAAAHIDQDWGNVDGRLFSANLDIDVNSNGADIGLVECTMTITNNDLVPLTIDIFNYADLDVNGLVGNEAIGDASHHQVRHLASEVVVEYRALGNTHFDVGAYSGIELGLADAVVLPTPPGVLAGGLPPFAGDYTGAYQWANNVIPPQGVARFTVQFCVRMVERYGAGGAGVAGVPEIHAEWSPVQDPAGPMPMDVVLENGAPFAPAFLVSGFAPGPAPLPFGMVLHVAPPPAATSLVITDAAGGGRVGFAIPPAPVYTGISLFHQYFVIDAAGLGGVASHTGGLRTTIIRRP